MRRARAAGPLGHRRATCGRSRAESRTVMRRAGVERLEGEPVILRPREHARLGCGLSSEERLEEAIELGFREDSGLAWRLDPLCSESGPDRAPGPSRSGDGAGGVASALAVSRALETGRRGLPSARGPCREAVG